MKLQIDTTLKTIKVEGTVSLLELTETLERLLPNGVWKTFSLETGVEIIWSNPVPYYPYWPYYPWWGTAPSPYLYGTMATNDGVTYTLTTSGGEAGSYTLVPGTYNIEI